MKRVGFGWSLVLAAGIVWATGCAAERVERTRAPKAPSPEPAAAASAKDADQNIKLPAGASQSPLPFEGEGWQSMFDGQTLAGWRETPFAGHGEAHCQQGVMVLSMGDPFTGLNWTNDFPHMDFEVALDAMRIMGSDFFCGLTVPVGTNCCSLIVGGWGGSLIGISSLDGMDASENETTKYTNFETGRWYRIRLRVTQKKIEVWIDKEKLISVNTTGRKITVRPGDIELSQPIGVSAWQTAAAFREIKFRRVNGPAGKEE
jgi:hypothetical protein